MKRVLTTFALLAVGFLAGTAAPHASAAADSGQQIVQELRAIKQALTDIRRVMENKEKKP